MSSWRCTEDTLGRDITMSLRLKGLNEMFILFQNGTLMEEICISLKGNCASIERLLRKKKINDALMMMNL